MELRGCALQSYSNPGKVYIGTTHTYDDACDTARLIPRVAVIPAYRINTVFELCSAVSAFYSGGAPQRESVRAINTSKGSTPGPRPAGGFPCRGLSLPGGFPCQGRSLPRTQCTACDDLSHRPISMHTLPGEARTHPAFTPYTSVAARRNTASVPALCAPALQVWEALSSYNSDSQI